jgi:predicted RNase H-like nuclease
MEKLTVQQKEIETLLCTAVGTASHQHGLEACTVYGDHTARYHHGLEDCVEN